MYGLEPEYNQYSGMAPSPCSGFPYCPAQKQHSSKYGEFMIILLPVSVGHIVARNPFASAKLARISGCLKGASRVKITRNN